MTDPFTVASATYQNAMRRVQRDRLVPLQPGFDGPLPDPRVPPESGGAAPIIFWALVALAGLIGLCAICAVSS